nr:hypothetical protein [Megavirus caiporensis]
MLILPPHEQKIYISNDQSPASHQIVESNKTINLHDIGIRNNNRIHVIYKAPICNHDQ